jgi:Tripartite tricarboxylate transporter TctB family
MTVNIRDIGAGLIFIAIGILFGLGALGLELGTALRMGPGYFPLVLAGILVVLGLVVLIQGFGHPTTGRLTVPWRGLVLILAAPVVFGLTVRGLGLVPAVMLVVLIAAFASRRMSVPLALILTVTLTLFCVLVFSFGLGLPLRLFGPWLAL